MSVEHTTAKPLSIFSGRAGVRSTRRWGNGIRSVFVVMENERVKKSLLSPASPPVGGEG